MSKVYCPFLMRVAGVRIKAFTFSLLLGLGVGGAMGCSGDEEPQEPVNAEGDAAAKPEGDADALPVDENAGPADDAAAVDAPPVESVDDQLSAAVDAAVPEVPAEGDSDAMLAEAQANAPVAVIPPPAPIMEVKQNTKKQANYKPVSQNVSNGAKGSGGAYIVKSGDTLAGISRKIYGQADMWHPLVTLNGISDPSRIYPGDVIQFDALNEASKAFAASQVSTAQTVTVKAGDTLSSIAQAVLGNSGHWKVLYSRNKDKIKNPNLIEPGMVLSYSQDNTASTVQPADQAAPQNQPATAKKQSASTEAPAKKGKNDGKAAPAGDNAQSTAH